METETLTFDFGTTPEEVIRERCEAVAVDGEVGSIGHEMGMVKYLSADDLLTVLDALTVAAATTRYRTDRKDGSPMFNCDGEGNRLPDYMQRPCGQDEARRLRISILAALGVTEV